MKDVKEGMTVYLQVNATAIAYHVLKKDDEDEGVWECQESSTIDEIESDYPVYPVTLDEREMYPTLRECQQAIVRYYERNLTRSKGEVDRYEKLLIQARRELEK